MNRNARVYHNCHCQTTLNSWHDVSQMLTPHFNQFSLWLFEPKPGDGWMCVVNWIDNLQLRHAISGKEGSDLASLDCGASTRVMCVYSLTCYGMPVVSWFFWSLDCSNMNIWRSRHDTLVASSRVDPPSNASRCEYRNVSDLTGTIDEGLFDFIGSSIRFVFSFWCPKNLWYCQRNVIISWR